MAKIVLVQNAYKKEIPLGLISLKSALDQTTHESWIHDLNVETVESLDSIMREKQPDFLGISVGIATHKEDVELIREVRASVQTVVGGVFASAPGVFESADHVIMGRGESPLVSLLDAHDGIVSPVPDQSINPGLVRFEAYTHPHDFRGNREFPLFTSLGCVFDCMYCSIPAHYRRKVWYKQPASFIEELHKVVGMGVHHVRLVDDLFGVHPSRTELLLAILKDMAGIEGVYAQMRVEVAREETLRKMRESRFSGLYLGIETGNAQTLQRIGKRYDQETIISCVRNATELGLDVTGAFTIGYPWETEGEITGTLELSKRLQGEFGLRPRVYIVTPFPNTRLFREIDKRRIRNWDYSLWDAVHAVMDTDHLKSEQIQRMYEQHAGS